MSTPLLFKIKPSTAYPTGYPRECKRDQHLREAKEAKAATETSQAKLEQKEIDIADSVYKMFKKINNELIIAVSEDKSSWITIEMPLTYCPSYKTGYHACVDRAAFTEICAKLKSLDFRYEIITYRLAISVYASPYQLEIIQQQLKLFSEQFDDTSPSADEIQEPPFSASEYSLRALYI